MLDGIFSDEHGDYPCRNLCPQSAGQPACSEDRPGCSLFVKLRQMPPTEQKRIVADTTNLDRAPGQRRRTRPT